MTKIQLQSICLRNFKGTQYLLLNMDGKDVNISGRNGSGKTTVYKAYYWCLTGKTLEANEVIQPLNVYNEVIHKVETSVSLTLRINDEYDVTLERKLVEKWKALGKPNEELKGTEQQRFWNEVPLSQKEFDAKLASICDLDKWLMLSDITKFMSLKTEDRRRALLGLAGEVNEEELMKPYPVLVRAIKERKTIDELKIQTLSTIKRANEELQTIPSQISAQDKLKSTEDFAALAKEKEVLDTQIADIDKLMQGSTEDLQATKEYREKVASAEKALEDYKSKWNGDHNASVEAQRKVASDKEKEYFEAEKAANKRKAENDARIEKKVKLQEEFAKIREEWEKENNSSFDFSTANSCPYCGHTFTEEEKNAKKAEAVEAFNQHKSERLKELQSEAEQKNSQILALTGFINEYNKIVKPQDDTQLDALKTALIEAQSLRDQIMCASVVVETEYIKLEKALEKAKSEKPATKENNNEELKQQKQELTARRDEVIRLLAGEQTNERIEAEKERLDARSKELAQIVATCDSILYDIQEYRRAKVSVVESKVNSFFSLAKWKFYEKNVSNDDYQEVCICHHRGIDYNSTNDSDRINLCVDIVAGLSKAYEICAPVFIDRAESVNKIITTENQQIALRVTEDDFTMK